MGCILKYGLINTLLCISINSSFANEDLLDIYKFSLEADSELKQAQIAYEIALETKKQDIARMLPSINITGEASRNSQKRSYDVSEFDGEEKYKSYGYTLTAKQPLIHYENNIYVKQANDRINQVNADLLAVRLSLMVRVSERYFDVLAADDNLRFIGAEKRAVERQLKQSERRLNAGMAAITDVYEAEARLDTTIAQEIEAQNQHANSLESLREITNRHHEKLKPLTESLVLAEPELLGVGKWEELAIQNNLQIVSLRHNNQSLRREISRRRACHYPTLDLVATYSKSISGGGDFGDSDTENRTIGLHLNIPIYEGGVVSSRTRKAVHLYEQNFEKLDAKIRAVRSKVHKDYLGVLASIARVRSLKQSFISNNKALKAIEAGFDVGMRTTSDVLQATKELYRAQRDYERSRYDYILNGLRLKQSAGNLSLSDLKKANLSLK